MSAETEDDQNPVEEAGDEVKETVDEAVEDGLDSLNDSIDKALSEVLNTRTRVVVYVALNKLGEATPEEVADETGLYPKRVENTLEDLKEEDAVEEVFGEDDTYKAVSPTELVRNLPERARNRVESLLERDDEDDAVEIEIQ